MTELFPPPVEALIALRSRPKRQAWLRPKLMVELTLDSMGVWEVRRNGVLVYFQITSSRDPMYGIRRALVAIGLEVANTLGILWGGLGDRW